MKKIMFSDKYGLTESVLSGIKTQTRRIVSERLWDRWTDYEDFCNSVGVGDIPTTCQYYKEEDFFLDNSPYKVGEVVAVAQSYSDFMPTDKILYRSVPEVNGYLKQKASELKGWSNKLFVHADLMPHQIRITNVRAERLQDISDEDCIKELGLEHVSVDMGFKTYQTHFVWQMTWEDKLGSARQYYHTSPKEVFEVMIEKIMGRGIWEENPWVFVYDFELVK